MTETITAIVENGILRPTTPLKFAEGTRLEVTIVVPKATGRVPSQAAKDAVKAIASLPMEPGPEFSGRDHDRILYGEQGEMIFVDTGAWFAVFVPGDPDHLAALAWFHANTEALITTDYVIDETLTLLRARGQRRFAIQAGTLLFSSEISEIHYLSVDEIAAAWQVFRGYSDKNWSFTDCTSKVVMESLGITTAFSFDQHFRQFGNVIVVP